MAKSTATLITKLIVLLNSQITQKKPTIRVDNKMKSCIKKLTNMIKICLPCLFYVSMSLSFQSFAGTWSTENSLSGMDSVHIYLPTTTPIINNKRALMINLHGCSMSNTDMKNNADWSPTADQFGMVVALPDVPGGGAFSLDCWDYYGENHSRTNKYNNEVINLAIALISRSELNIILTKFILLVFRLAVVKPM